MNDTTAMSNTSISETEIKPILKSSIVPVLEYLCSSYNGICDNGNAFHFFDVVYAEDIRSLKNRSSNRGGSSFDPLIDGKIEKHPNKCFPGRSDDDRAVKVREAA